MKHNIEIFSARRKTCQDTIATVKELSGSEHEIIVHDMHKRAIACRAAQHGVKSVPAVVINGKLAGCCAGRGVEENVLREAPRQLPMNATAVLLQSVVTCPRCGTATQETMPTDSCHFYYECSHCKTLLRTKPGDWCVFCSYGSVKCPPVQAQGRCDL